VPRVPKWDLARSQLRDQRAACSEMESCKAKISLTFSRNTEWVRRAADPAAFAVHLRTRPLTECRKNP
jgi:hypothetical protein